MLINCIGDELSTLSIPSLGAPPPPRKAVKIFNPMDSTLAQGEVVAPVVIVSDSILLSDLLGAVTTCSPGPGLNNSCITTPSMLPHEKFISVNELVAKSSRTFLSSRRVNFFSTILCPR
uniref:Uncharacterized protein n=1 Tax=Cacopsylla melanoneura TaxID=428564 RepID=A0A8D8M6T4_9HEMI